MKDTEFFNFANAKMTTYEPEQVFEVARAAFKAGVLIKIEGLPFGRFQPPREKTEIMMGEAS